MAKLAVSSSRSRRSSIRGPACGLPLDTQGRSRVPESGSLGSVRGALSNGRPYWERWIQRYVPEFEKRWNRFACKAGGSWRVDETYVKIKGCWTYLYRAVDSNGQSVDFLLRAKRDVAAAKAFFRRAFESQRSLPRAITLDGYQASH